MAEPDCVPVALGFDAGAFRALRQGHTCGKQGDGTNNKCERLLHVTLQVKRLNEWAMSGGGMRTPREPTPEEIWARRPSVRHALGRDGGLQRQTDDAEENGTPGDGCAVRAKR